MQNHDKNSIPIKKLSLDSVDFRTITYFSLSSKLFIAFFRSFIVDKLSELKTKDEVNEAILPRVSTLTFILGQPSFRPNSSEYSPILFAFRPTIGILAFPNGKNSDFPRYLILR